MRYQRAPSAIHRVVEGKAVLLRPEDGEYFDLNEVGTRIWQLLAEPHGVSELTESLLAELEVTEAELERDLRAFLRDLERAGMISPEEPTP